MPNVAVDEFLIILFCKEELVLSYVCDLYVFYTFNKCNLYDITTHCFVHL